MGCKLQLDYDKSEDLDRTYRSIDPGKHLIELLREDKSLKSFYKDQFLSYADDLSLILDKDYIDRRL